MLRVATYSLAVGMLLTGAFVVCAAQVPTPEGTRENAPAAESQTVRAISISEVAQEMERIDADLRRLRSLLASTDRLASARQALLQLETTIGRLETQILDIGPDVPTHLELSDAKSQWLRAADKLERTETTISAIAHDFESGSKRLADAYRVWIKTREDAAAQQTPSPVLERIEAVAGEIAEVQSELEQRLAASLMVLNRIVTDRIRVASALDQTDSIERELRRRVFRRSTPPLWVAFAKAADGPGLGETLRSSWGRHLAGIVDFVDNSRDRIALHFMSTVFLVILLTWLRRQARSVGRDDPDLKVASRVLSHPVPAALVVSLSCTVVLYPRAPGVVWEIAYVAAVAPLLVLVRAASHPRTRLSLYGLLGLFVFVHALNLVPGHVLLRRTGHLVLAVLALGGLLRILRRSKSEIPVSPGVWRRAAMLACRFAALLLTVAIAADVFGFTNLAINLTRGTLNSAYLAVVFLASTLILEGALATELRTELARNLRMVRDYPKLLKRRLTGLIRFLALIVWVMVTLLVFDLRAPFSSGIQAILERKWSIGSLALSAGSVVAFVFTIWISIQISRFVRFALNEDVFPRVTLARGLPGTISMLVRYGIIAAGFLLAVAAAGIELSDFAILAGALGVGIGFGLQNLVNNFVSGLILAFERPVQIGDTIEVGQLLGEVKKIGIRTSTVRTLEGAEVIVPNGDLVSAQVTNWTLSDRRRRIQVLVGVAYGTDPEKVIDLLTEVANAHVDVLEHPSPNVLFKGFGDSSLNFDLRFWTGRFELWREVRSQVTVEVSVALKKAGIEIPFPQRDLHVRSVDPRAARALGAEVDERAQADADSAATGDRP